MDGESADECRRDQKSRLIFGAPRPLAESFPSGSTLSRPTITAVTITQRQSQDALLVSSGTNPIGTCRLRHGLVLRSFVPLGNRPTGRAVSIDQSDVLLTTPKLSPDWNGGPQFERSRLQPVGNLSRSNFQRSSANDLLPEWQYVQPLRTHVSPEYRADNRDELSQLVDQLAFRQSSPLDFFWPTTCDAHRLRPTYRSHAGRGCAYGDCAYRDYANRCPGVSNGSSDSHLWRAGRTGHVSTGHIPTRHIPTRHIPTRCPSAEHLFISGIPVERLPQPATSRGVPGLRSQSLWQLPARNVSEQWIEQLVDRHNHCSPNTNSANDATVPRRSVALHLHARQHRL
jgi:hypothetical protein